MKELELPIKRPRGRPRGGTNKKRVRRSEIQVALDGIAKKSPNITQALIDTIAQMDVETDKLRFLVNEYARVFKQRKTTQKALTAAIQKMSQQKSVPTSKSQKITIHIDLPVDLVHEFNNIIEESPLNKSEIFANLMLNYIKAHNSFSHNPLKEIASSVNRLERQEYRNTKVAAEMLVNAPYDAVRSNGQGNVAKGSLTEITTVDEVYAQKVDEKYTEDEVVKAIEKNGGFVDMSELFDRE